MFTEMRERVHQRHQRAAMNRTIDAASQPLRDKLIIMAQRQGLL